MDILISLFISISVAAGLPQIPQLPYTVYSGEVTHYCSCVRCGGPLDARGNALRSGVAAGNWLSLGSRIIVDGELYTISDRGGRDFNAVGRIDIFVPDGHEKALELGRHETNIIVLEDRDGC